MHERLTLAQTLLADHHEEGLLTLLHEFLSLRSTIGDNLSEQTFRSYARSTRSFLEFFRNSQIQDISVDDVYGWIVAMQRSGLGPSTIRVRLAGSQRLFAALQWCGLQVDPVRAVRAPRDFVAPWEKRQPYDDAEISKMARIASGEDLMILLLGAHAGLRCCELVSLHWGDIDFKKKTLRVVRNAKRGKTRHVPMSKSLVIALKKYRNFSGRIFKSFTTTRQAYNRMKSLAERARVEYRGVHSLRHSAGTRLMRETKSLEDVSRVLGHSHLDMARIYAKWSDTSARKAMANW